jgi:PAS domain S-box-containing protein
MLAAASSPWLRLTKSRRATKAWYQSHAAFEQAPQAIILLDALTLQVVRGNAALQKVSGYSADELLGLTAAR